MAKLNKKHPQNAAGNIYVDTTCINCDSCRWLAPDIFAETEDQSVVTAQPTTQSQYDSALMAIVACPSRSIGLVDNHPRLDHIQNTFPVRISHNVYYCGYHSKKSFGAASYLICRPEGNILIDCPRYSSILANNIKSLGGIKYHFFTHKDDVADHEKYHKHFNTQRIIHHEELCDTISKAEITITSNEPYQLCPDTHLIPTPGHTKGHMVLLYKDSFLFTGDHLAFSRELNHLYAFRRHCWYSWPEQIKSMESLLNYSFEWILPGHGTRYHTDKSTMRKDLITCLKWMPG
ncbi:MAG: MBL fold metallo-hydrolase [Spirochaetota bacterium]|nr:MBL fold metallo-hydrolase [Spirochaetota bacterium]